MVTNTLTARQLREWYARPENEWCSQFYRAHLRKQRNKMLKERAGLTLLLLTIALVGYLATGYVFVDFIGWKAVVR